jgi:SAM-dependent methyltransferase
VAWALGRSHPALQGEVYGARLYQRLRQRGLSTSGRVVEVGPGSGELCRSFLERAAFAGEAPSSWLRLDASPALLELQDRRCPGTEGRLAEVPPLPLPDASVDLLLCNEVIADLRAVPDDPAAPPSTPAVQELRALRQRHSLPAWPHRAWYNLGAWQLVAEIARCLAPGGWAFLSEFGHPTDPPEEAVQLDHPEVSICWSHLKHIARDLGMEAELCGLDELLGLDLSARQLWRGSFEGLRARMRLEGHHLEARAWSPDRIELPWPVEGLCWVPMSEEGPGPLVTRFQALLLRRPEA